MKLATFKVGAFTVPRVGALCSCGGIEHLIDVRTAYARVLTHVDADPLGEAVAQARVPTDMVRFLEGGAPTMLAARRGVSHILDLITAGAAAEALIIQGALYPLARVELLAPIPRPGKIIAIGANYLDHVQEGRDSGALGGSLPPYPPAFMKMPSGVIGPDAPIVFPTFGKELDYEVELSIVIGKRCKDVAPEDWLDVVAGYTMINDLSLRDVILEEKDSGLVFVGKNFATACPLGPYLVTKDEIANPDDLALQLKVNGQLRQRDRTRSMIYKCAAIISYWSKMGFEAGDVITTGTPGGGAGFGRKFPDRLLKIGDVVEAEVEGLGVLRNRVECDPNSRASAVEVQAMAIVT